MAFDPNQSEAPELEIINNQIDELSNSNIGTPTTAATDTIVHDGNPNVGQIDDAKMNTFDNNFDTELTCQLSYVIQNKYFSGNGRITGRVC